MHVVTFVFYAVGACKLWIFRVVSFETGSLAKCTGHSKCVTQHSIMYTDSV